MRIKMDQTSAAGSVHLVSGNRGLCSNFQVIRVIHHATRPQHSLQKDSFPFGGVNPFSPEPWLCRHLSMAVFLLQLTNLLMVLFTQEHVWTPDYNYGDCAVLASVAHVTQASLVQAAAFVPSLMLRACQRFWFRCPSPGFLIRFRADFWDALSTLEIVCLSIFSHIY